MSNKTSEIKISETSDNSSERVSLVVVRSTIERFFFQKFIFIIPAVYIFRSFIEYLDSRTFPYTLLDFSKILTELAVIIALICSNLLFTSIPDTLSQLFLGDVILQRKQGIKHNDKSLGTFVRDFDFWLNRSARKFFGFFTALAMFVYYISSEPNFGGLIGPWNSILPYVDRLLYSLPTVFYAYFVGIVIWNLSTANYAFISLLLTGGIVGSILGLVPIFKFHQVMLSQREEMLELLNQISQRIVALKLELSRSSSNAGR
jgi:hypothetical protein